MFVQRLYSLLMDHPEDRPLLRIGELSRRLGVSEYVLRAWESRYGLLAGALGRGFRMYSETDESRIRRMQATSPAGYQPPRQRAPCFARTAWPVRTSPGPPGRAWPHPR